MSNVAARNRPNRSLEHQIREECGQACANPNCREWSTPTHELHHIDGNRAHTVRENLLLLCANCHSKQQVGVFSESDVRLWKRMAEVGALPPPKGMRSGTLVENNFGIAGHTINIEAVRIQSPRKGRREITPGLLEADPEMRTYADYLVKRYIEWRHKGAAIDKRRFSPGSAHGILGEGFGSPSSVFLIPQPRFFDWVQSAQSKIDNTTWGRINKRKNGRNYHSWDEHLRERLGK
jgi:hypothetical protein